MIGADVMQEDMTTESIDATGERVFETKRLTYMLTLAIAISFIAFYLWRSKSPFASSILFTVFLVCTASISIIEVKRTIR